METSSLPSTAVDKAEKSFNILKGWNALHETDVKNIGNTDKSNTYDYVGDFALYVTNEKIIDASGNITPQSGRLSNEQLTTLTTLYLSSIRQVFDGTYSGDNPQRQLTEMGNLLVKFGEANNEASQAIRKGIIGATETETLIRRKQKIEDLGVIDSIKKLWQRRTVESAKFKNNSKILEVINTELRSNPNNEKVAGPHEVIISSFARIYRQAETAQALASQPENISLLGLARKQQAQQQEKKAA